MEPIRVMVNGLPGRMASEVADLLLEQPGGFQLIPYSLTGPEVTDRYWSRGEVRVNLVRPEARAEVEQELNQVPLFLAVDYTLPDAVMDNVEYYCAKGWPFVVGTTGADYAIMRERVAQSGVSAVANPNMSIPIVLIQSALDYLAGNFPGALEGWTAQITESHQKGKVDTSGTAKHLVRYFKELGVQAEVEQIEKIRDPRRQREAGIPEEYLGGHAYHTYRLRSPDQTVELGFIHNVLGRRTYALGTLKSLEFLSQQIEAGSKGRLYSMLDVLRETSRERNTA